MTWWMTMPNINCSEKKCIYCGSELRWLADYMSEEYGWQGAEGVISEFNCDSCGAEYVVCVPTNHNEDKE